MKHASASLLGRVQGAAPPGVNVGLNTDSPPGRTANCWGLPSTDWLNCVMLPLLPAAAGGAWQAEGGNVSW